MHCVCLITIVRFQDELQALRLTTPLEKRKNMHTSAIKVRSIECLLKYAWSKESISGAYHWWENTIFRKSQEEVLNLLICIFKCHYLIVLMQ